jgi:hypothetical protein
MRFAVRPNDVERRRPALLATRPLELKLESMFLAASIASHPVAPLIWSAKYLVSAYQQ